MQRRRSPSIPLMTHHMLCLSSSEGCNDTWWVICGSFWRIKGENSWDCVKMNFPVSVRQRKTLVMSLENYYSFPNSIVLDTGVPSNYSIYLFFKWMTKKMRVSCVICLDSSSRTENLVDDSVTAWIVSQITQRAKSGNFFCFIHIFPLPSSKKDAVAGGGFSTEPDMSCVCFYEVIAWIIVCLKFLLFDIDTHILYVVSDTTHCTTKKE